MAYTSEQIIRHGEAISRLLNDESVQQVLTDLEARYYAKWKAAETPAERELLWAQMRVVSDFEMVLKGTVDSGLVEVAMVERREREANQT